MLPNPVIKLIFPNFTVDWQFPTLETIFMGKKIIITICTWTVFFLIYLYSLAKGISFDEIIRGILLSTAVTVLIDMKSANPLFPISRIRNKGLFLAITCILFFSLWLMSMLFLSDRPFTIEQIWKPIMITALVGLLLAFNIWLYPTKRNAGQ